MGQDQCSQEAKETSLLLALEIIGNDRRNCKQLAIILWCESKIALLHPVVPDEKQITAGTFFADLPRSTDANFSPSMPASISSGNCLHLD